MAGTFTRNFRDEEWREPTEGYQGPLPQKGLYPLTLVAVGDHESKKGNDSVKWTFKMTADAGKDDESYEGWVGSIYTTDESAWKEQQILVALGAIKPNGAIKITYDALLKKFGRVVVMGRVIRERYIPEDGDPEWTAKLTTVMKARDGAKTSTRKGKLDDDEDEDYDDTDDADEVDDEPTPARSRRRKPDPEPEPDEEEEEGDEGDDEEIDLDELAEELEALSLVNLKKRARDEYGLKIARGDTAEKIIDAILDKVEADAESADEDDEDEEEEEPPAPPARRAARGSTAKAKPAAAAPARSSRKRGEPPF